MFELVVNGAFEAAHRLVDYPGKCNRLHGHSWTVEMSVSGDKLDNIGMVADFKVLKSMLMEVLDAMDHQYLNELPQFKELNPTAEHLAKYIYETIEANDLFKTNVSIQLFRDPEKRRYPAFTTMNNTFSFPLTGAVNHPALTAG